LNHSEWRPGYGGDAFNPPTRDRQHLFELTRCTLTAATDAEHMDVGQFRKIGRPDFRDDPFIDHQATIRFCRFSDHREDSYALGIIPVVNDMLEKVDIGGRYLNEHVAAEVQTSAT
jgi:hypothetical protein